MPETISIAAFQNGDKEAFNHVFNMFYKRVCFFAAGIVNEDGAEDIVQDAFIKLWERRNSFNNLNAIKAFLYLTTKNSCINTYKHQKVVDKFESAPVDITDESNIIFHLIEAEVLEEVQQAVQQNRPIQSQTPSGTSSSSAEAISTNTAVPANGGTGAQPMYTGSVQSQQQSFNTSHAGGQMQGRFVQSFQQPSMFCVFVFFYIKILDAQVQNPNSYIQNQQIQYQSQVIPGQYQACMP